VAALLTGRHRSLLAVTLHEWCRPCAASGHMLLIGGPRGHSGTPKSSEFSSQCAEQHPDTQLTAKITHSLLTRPRKRYKASSHSYNYCSAHSREASPKPQPCLYVSSRLYMPCWSRLDSTSSHCGLAHPLMFSARTH
jgi:hypothetical protein